MEFLSEQGRVNRRETIPTGKAAQALDAAEYYMRYINETSEILVRLAVRERAIKNGMAEYKKANKTDPDAKAMKQIKLDATSQARDYIDFSQGGSWAKAIDSFFPYFELNRWDSYDYRRLTALAESIQLYFR